jgi:hypothetical protein
MWFDDTYMPKDKAFIAAFTSSEHLAISAFNNSLEKLILQAGDPPPPPEVLCGLPLWAEVKLRANNVLEKLNA